MIRGRREPNAKTGFTGVLRHPNGKAFGRFVLDGVYRSTKPYDTPRKAAEALYEMRKEYGALSREEVIVELFKCTLKMRGINPLQEPPKLFHSDKAMYDWRRRREITVALWKGEKRSQIVARVGTTESGLKRDLDVICANLMCFVRESNLYGRYDGIIAKCEKALRPRSRSRNRRSRPVGSGCTSGSLRSGG